ncbi:hypothetical protein EEB12_15515 [Rhodococcus sp. WS1]|nr:hypothetical protein EEB12_15515 [Rhodococcus sp. WS1]TQC37786.1 hypothetical protein EEB16_11910 [Rhodococcus sp. WS7]
MFRHVLPAQLAIDRRTSIVAGIGVALLFGAQPAVACRDRRGINGALTRSCQAGPLFSSAFGTAAEAARWSSQTWCFTSRFRWPGRSLRRLRRGTEPEPSRGVAVCPAGSVEISPRRYIGHPRPQPLPTSQAHRSCAQRLHRNAPLSGAMNEVSQGRKYA